MKKLHPVLKMIKNEEAIPCGSGMYQTCQFKTGSNEFLGRLPGGAKKQLIELHKAQPKTKWIIKAVKYEEVA